ncbi:MAG: type I-C CRISPR-associated protein Cas7/Csd2 [Oscillospiraceae bacterium]|nr:type I-C CRISPR-associated protein Cas7/Csd2 [Oscillospiraceae bacterium]
MNLTKKIDFAIIIGVKNANPNGDPLNGNRPRTNYDGFGEISDVCIKRKIRNRLLDAGEAILVQSDDYRNDDFRSIKDRYDSADLPKTKDSAEKAKDACAKWIDVRAFGQVLAGVDETNASISIRGPVSIQSAFSVEPIDVSSLQITKSVNLTTNKKDPSQKSGDTMGMKHRVDRGVYVTFGSMSRQLAEKTGFSDGDAEKLKDAMRHMFENDESSSRPGGSMEVLKVIWWTHIDEVLASAKVHRSLTVNPDGTYTLSALDGIATEELDGR